MALHELFIEKSHSELLACLIKDIISYCGITLGQLSAVAISKGPGSYTGLRIGTSTAKGLCFSLDVPLIAINTLEAMTYGIKKFNLREALLCPMLDARRMEVYCSIIDSNFKIIKATYAAIIDENSFKGLLNDREMLFFGDGAAKCEKVLGKDPNARFIHDVRPSASGVGYLATAKFAQGSFEDLAYFEPFYLKDFKAGKPKTN